MNREEIIEITKKIGVAKGYRLGFPEDWYGGITNKELSVNNVHIRRYLRIFGSLNSIIRACFPKYCFLEWKFKRAKNGWWEEEKNKIKYLTWLEKKLGWNKPEDWYNISKKKLIGNFGISMCNKYKISKIPSILYKSFNFKSSKFKIVERGYYDNFENLKKILNVECEKKGRMLSAQELKNIKLDKAVDKHGGIIVVAKLLQFETITQYKTLSGDVVKSSYEVLFSNFLYLNNVPFQSGEKIFENKNYYYDFKINDFYIEIWGFMNVYSYNEKRKIKERLYRDEGLVLISIERDIFKKNINTINSYFIELLKKYKIKEENFYTDDLSKMKEFQSFDKKMVFEEFKNKIEEDEIKKFPTKEWWINNGFKKHVNFLYSRKLNLTDVSNYIGIEDVRKPVGYWKNWDNMKSVLLEMCEKLGRFPENKDFTELNQRNVYGKMNKYHGGIYEAAKKIGYPIYITPKIDYKNEKNKIISQNKLTF